MCDKLLRIISILLFSGVLTASLAGCNLQTSPATAVSSLSATDLPSNGTKPNVTIVSPANGIQGLANQPLTVRIRATDAFGITRVVMSESDRITSQQQSPDPSTDFEALLTYQPKNVGTFKLSVVAYRQNVASDPASITVQIVADKSQLTNPNALDATTGSSTGAICTARVNISTLNLRSGPGTTYGSIGLLGVGEMVDVIGRNTDSSWLQIKRRSTARMGWAAASYLRTTGDCSKAPVVNP